MDKLTALMLGVGSLCTTLQENPLGALALVVIVGIVSTTVIIWRSNRRR